MTEKLNILSEDEQLPQADRCRSLLCKGMYLNYGLSEEDRVTGDGHFWCNKTQAEFGPDGQLVSDGDCRHVGRGCYDSPA